MTGVLAYRLPLRNRFRGITVREGVLLRGPAGWAEWSPFAEYAFPETGAWWRAAWEAANVGFPAPVRDRVPVNVTVPAVDAATAHRLVATSSCTTAKVKVAERGQAFAEDLDRVEAVRDALGPSGRVRVDVNGGWQVDEAVVKLTELSRFGLEYAEQPCATAEDLAELRVRLARGGVDVLIAADESIRRQGDPERVVALDAADIAVLKVQPLGGVRRCLELAERLGLPVVVSSALESSVGLRLRAEHGRDVHRRCHRRSAGRRRRRDRRPPGDGGRGRVAGWARGHPALACPAGRVARRTEEDR